MQQWSKALAARKKQATRPTEKRGHGTDLAARKAGYATRHSGLYRRVQ
jgi:hypothetical protein